MSKIICELYSISSKNRKSLIIVECINAADQKLISLANDHSETKINAELSSTRIAFKDVDQDVRK